MTYPAWFELHRDAVLRQSPAAVSVYAYLLGEYANIMHEPTPVKSWVVAGALGLHKETVLIGFNLLVRRGYLIEHARGFKGTRTFTIAIHRRSSHPNPTGLSA